jgi:A/G-specific adenine glycosylase
MTVPASRKSSSTSLRASSTALPARPSSQQAALHGRPRPLLSSSQVRTFRKKILDHYARCGRDLPWRKRITPYRVLVSEIMLQQTQVDRVIEKYKVFLAAFPDFSVLATAPTAGLLKLWSGLGYNRRALALKKLAEAVVTGYRGTLPSDPKDLVRLPGIGPYTAGAIAAFAFNEPVVFLDTNIRRVFIHEFFRDRHGIRDEEIVPLLERTLPRNDARTWYNALMDYGSVLKREEGNANLRSAHYTRQSPYENSNRQVRGAILKLLVKGPGLSSLQIAKKTGMDAERIGNNLVRLAAEGFIVHRNGRYRIA